MSLPVKSWCAKCRKVLHIDPEHRWREWSELRCCFCFGPLEDLPSVPLMVGASELVEIVGFNLHGFWYRDGNISLSMDI